MYKIKVSFILKSNKELIMTKEKFIKDANKRTEDLENAIQDILSNITGYDNYELDWRDDKELEIHFNEEDSEDWGFCDQEDLIIAELKSRGFDVEDHEHIFHLVV